MTQHVVFLHPELSYSGHTHRVLSTARVCVEAGARVTLLGRSGSRHAAAEALGLTVEPLELLPGPLGRPFVPRRLVDRLIELKPDLLHATDLRLARLAATAARRVGVPYLLGAPAAVQERVDLDPGLLRGVLVPSESLDERLINAGRIPRELLVHQPSSPDEGGDRGRVPAGDPGDGPGDGKVGGGPHPLQDRGDESVRGGEITSASDDPPPDGGAPSPAPEVGPIVPFDHPGPPRIGCTGRFDEGFAGDWFLEAVRILVREGKAWDVLMLGEGPAESALRRRVRDADLTGRVTIGVPTTHTSRQTLASLDVHVACRTDTGPGWLTAQTLRLGIPNIAVASGEAFHMFRDQETGILVPPDDARRLADELTALVQNPARARALGYAGRQANLAAAPRAEFEARVRELHGL